MALTGIVLLSGCAATGAAGSASATESSPARTTGPLDEFFGGPAGPQSDEEMQAQERRIQEAIVACMTAEGFEYRPYTPVAPTDDYFTEWGTRAFAEKYGYGIANSPYDDQAFDPSADPNQAIVEAMSPAEQDAYYAALHGAPVTEPTDGAELVLPEDMGCWGKAQEEVYGVGPGPGEFEELFNRLGGLYEQAGTDPAVVEAEQRWASCLSDAGHPGYTDVDAPQEEISRRIEEYYSATYPEPNDPSGGGTTVPESWTPPPPDDPALVALQHDEITLAVADFDCRERAGYQRAFDAAHLSLEEQFVRDNRAELERLREATDTGGG